MSVCVCSCIRVWRLTYKMSLPDFEEQHYICCFCTICVCLFIYTLTHKYVCLIWLLHYYRLFIYIAVDVDIINFYYFHSRLLYFFLFVIGSLCCLCTTAKKFSCHCAWKRFSCFIFVVLVAYFDELDFSLLVLSLFCNWFSIVRDKVDLSKQRKKREGFQLTNEHILTWWKTNIKNVEHSMHGTHIASSLITVIDT